MRKVYRKPKLDEIVHGAEVLINWPTEALPELLGNPGVSDSEDHKETIMPDFDGTFHAARDRRSKRRMIPATIEVVDAEVALQTSMFEHNPKTTPTKGQPRPMKAFYAVTPNGRRVKLNKLKQSIADHDIEIYAGTVKS